MSLETAILKTIHDAGYIVRTSREVDAASETGEIHTVEAQNLLDGHRYVIRAPCLSEAATELAAKLGFDLEE